MDLSGRVWGATRTEQSAPYPCDSLVAGRSEGWTRAVDIAAPPSLVFRWLRQLSIAPYSYDWIDFRGRQSPRVLLPDLPDLSAGQPFLIFEITSFATDAHITCALPEALAERHGHVAVSYTLRPQGAGSRLVVKVVARAGATTGSRVRRRFLALGDLIMMRKQLLTLKKLSERPAASGAADLATE
ncbi:hypothetical protein [Streptomyces graminilatus]|uniref:hypothetical protein n=1 Tax=Streptomyces graminilatus TaxID=1464070 RepID=UPI0006E354C0|nr:hypothetical protein [Streptomyces graminilatus]